MNLGDKNVLLELYKHVSMISDSVATAKCVAACAEEFFDNPGEHHGGFEFTMNLLTEESVERFMRDSSLPPEAYESVDNAAMLWYLFADGITKAIDADSSRIYRGVAQSHLRLLKEDDWECVGVTVHDELVVTSFSALFGSLVHLETLDSKVQELITAPWTSSGGKVNRIIRDYLASLD
jgi:hypothetical protein